MKNMLLNEFSLVKKMITTRTGGRDARSPNSLFVYQGSNCFQKSKIRGFTLIELVVACTLMMLLAAFVAGQMQTLSRGSQQSAAGAAELMETMRFVEQFRNDVRAAKDARIGTQGSSVRLVFPAESVFSHSSGWVDYSETADGALMRKKSSGEIETLELMKSARFSLENAGHIKDAPLLRMCVRCGGPQPAGNTRAGESRSIILDTALRARSAQKANR